MYVRTSIYCVLYGGLLAWASIYTYTQCTSYVQCQNDAVHIVVWTIVNKFSRLTVPKCWISVKCFFEDSWWQILDLHHDSWKPRIRLRPRLRTSELLMTDESYLRVFFLNDIVLKRNSKNSFFANKLVKIALASCSNATARTLHGRTT